MRIALAQLRVGPGERDHNLDRAVDAVDEAADRGAEVVVLPELFGVGYFAFELYQRLAEPVEGPTVSRLREAATGNGVAVLCGSIVEDLGATESVETPAEEGLANTAVLLDAEGSRELVYRKRHLFGYGSAEAELLEPGRRLPTTSLGGFEVGVATCYDLRFPAQFGDLAAAGAELVLVPSAWPYPRLEHWEVLPKARAVENAFYVAAANGVGEFEDASLLGRSTTYDPWGTAIATTGTEPGLVLADLGPERVSEVREEFPAWKDRFE